MGWNAEWREERWLVVEPLSVWEARAFVGEHLVAHGLRHLVDPVQLVASELATNALVHARTPFTVSLSASDGTVLVAVEDRSAARPRASAPPVMDSHGRGLAIVDAVSDSWGVSEEDGTKTVWASFAKRSLRPV